MDTLTDGQNDQSRNLLQFSLRSHLAKIKIVISYSVSRGNGRADL